MKQPQGNRTILFEVKPPEKFSIKTTDNHKRYSWTVRSNTANNNCIDNFLELNNLTHSVHGLRFWETGKAIACIDTLLWGKELWSSTRTQDERNLKQPASPITWVIKTLTSRINLEINQESIIAELNDTCRISTIKEALF